MKAPHEILIVDDDALVRNSLKKFLEGEGFSVEIAKCREEALAKVKVHRPDLVLLDLYLPQLVGHLVCQELRSLDQTLPIIILTSLPDEVSLIKGLRAGANDFVSKSCSPSELLARISASITRSEAMFVAPPNEGSHPTIGAAVIDFARMVIEVDGTQTPITRSEVIVLRALIETSGSYLSAEDIISLLYGPCYIGDDKVVTSLMRRLRQKLGSAGKLIVNRRSCGYKIV